MRSFIVLFLSILLFALVGCSKRVVIIKGSAPENNHAQVIGAGQSNIEKSDHHLSQAKKFYNKAKYGQSKKHCEKAIDFNHRNWEAHYYLGLTLQKRREYTVSIEVFGACLKYSPKNQYVKSEIHYAIGINYERLGSYNQAEKAYGEALAFNPKNKLAFKAKNRVKVEKTLKKRKSRKNHYNEYYDG